MKFVILTCLSVIILCIGASVLPGEVKRVLDFSGTLSKDNPIPIQSGITLRDSIVGFGMKLLGTPYVKGACSKIGFDCSGFVYFVFRHFNIQVPRSTSQFSNFGKEIPIDRVRKGDILVFLSPTRNVIGHVGIVCKAKGMESDFIHATSGHQMKVIRTSLKQERYRRRFVKAMDVIL
jgi:cell wall-associated NlpC family hydrolase